MTGWTILGVGTVCTAGVLVFLQLAADAIAGARESLCIFENNERKAYRLRLQGVAYVVGPPAAVLSDSSDTESHDNAAA